jgi:hypothetical protein
MTARVLLIAGLLVAPPALAATRVVHPDGSGDWPTIQSAISASQPGDVIELSDGTFRGPGNRDLDLLGKAVTVRSQSDDPQACVIDCQGSESDPHRGFSFSSGEGAATIIRGVTVTGGLQAGC